MKTGDDSELTFAAFLGALNRFKLLAASHRTADKQVWANSLAAEFTENELQMIEDHLAQLKELRNPTETLASDAPDDWPEVIE